MSAKALATPKEGERGNCHRRYRHVVQEGEKGSPVVGKNCHHPPIAGARIQESPGAGNTAGTGELYSSRADRCLRCRMRSECLYRLLDPEASGPARAFRVLHHAMVAAGDGVLLPSTG